MGPCDISPNPYNVDISGGIFRVWSSECSAQVSRGPPEQVILQTWVPLLAYRLFGSKEVFESLESDARADGVHVGFNEQYVE